MGFGTFETAFWQLQHTNDVPSWQTKPPWPHPHQAVHDGPGLVERNEINRESHPTRVDTPAGCDPHRFVRLEDAPPQEPDGSFDTGAGDAHPVGNHPSGVEVARDDPHSRRLG